MLKEDVQRSGLIEIVEQTWRVTWLEANRITGYFRRVNHGRT